MHGQLDMDVDGRMMDMVKKAKEVRRLIRAWSLDSTGPDLSLGELGPNEDLGASTAGRLEQLDEGLDQIKDNCGSIENYVSSYCNVKTNTGNSAQRLSA